MTEQYVVVADYGGGPFKVNTQADYLSLEPNGALWLTGPSGKVELFGPAVWKYCVRKESADAASEDGSEVVEKTAFKASVRTSEK